MYFHPAGQFSAPPLQRAIFPKGAWPQPPPKAELSPVVGLLDGIPLENHLLLQGRLVVDDPDDWASSCQANHRNHGTAMASLIMHGELDSRGEPLGRGLYLRPIIRPDPADTFNNPPGEAIPEDILAVDLIHRAVVRMCEGDNGLPAAPHVRIVNLSIASRYAPFYQTVSPWARLLDWLASKYQLLFVVCAGNHSHRIGLDTPYSLVGSIPHDELAKLTLYSIIGDMRNRRILCPSEAINVLTVGAAHQDSAPDPVSTSLVDVFPKDSFPSPLTALGLGYRRSIKPDVIAPGGRLVFRPMPDSGNSRAILEPVSAAGPPGHCVACPSRVPGVLTGSTYCRGTSNSAALTTRAAAQIHNSLMRLRDEPGGDILQDDLTAVLVKALLVHSASWGGAREALEPPLREAGFPTRQRTELISRLMGYGCIRPDRVFDCTAQRATLVGCGWIEKDCAVEYEIPLPPSLSSKKAWRRLTVTLAWLSPTRPDSWRYRCAALWFSKSFSNSDSPLGVSEQEVEYYAARRGTVQHEIFEGDSADAYGEGDSVVIRVNCREDAPPLVDPVPYGLVVSLEVAEGVEIPVYDEIRTRVLAPVKIAPLRVAPFSMG